MLKGQPSLFWPLIEKMTCNLPASTSEIMRGMLQMFCSDPAYDKSLQQLQSFLSGLAAEEKLELRDGMYYLKK